MMLTEFCKWPEVTQPIKGRQPLHDLKSNEWSIKKFFTLYLHFFKYKQAQMEMM